MSVSVCSSAQSFALGQNHQTTTDVASNLSKEGFCTVHSSKQIYSGTVLTNQMVYEVLAQDQ
jgi:hypothetical protein